MASNFASPFSGEGLNLWFYRVSRVLHPYRAPAEIIELLSAATTGEPVREEDLRKQRIAIQIVRDVLDETFQYFQRVPARLRRVRAP